MFYSKSTGGFYDPEIHGEREIEVVQTDPDTGETIDRWMEMNPDTKIPADAVEITAEEHVALLAGQSAGQRIGSDAGGYPVLIDPPPPTAAELSAAIRAERNARLAACDWTMLPDAPLSAAQVSSWQTYRQALRDLTDQAGFPAAVVWPVAP
ncbi:MAG: putative phage tail fiber protein [Proteobacteria bacterium]|nr:putative phage tail fiber protein [Pseudomonadota bacterium]